MLRARRMRCKCQHTGRQRGRRIWFSPVPACGICPRSSRPGLHAGTESCSRPTLYSGSLSPGGYGWKYTAPVEPVAARALVAAFNGGFQFPSSDGGYFSEGKIVFPLRVGGASFVIYKNGSSTVGQWGRDATMGPRWLP